MGKGKIQLLCYRKGKVILEEALGIYHDTERDCGDFYKKILNISPEKAFELQREERLKGREFAYTEKALELSSEANKIATDANKLSYDSRLLAWIAITVSVLTFIAKYYK